MPTSIQIFRGRGPTPEEITDRAMARIIQAAEDAPAPIRDQVNMFRVKLRSILEGYMREAAHGKKMTIYNAVKEVNPEIAELIMKL